MALLYSKQASFPYNIHSCKKRRQIQTAYFVKYCPSVFTTLKGHSKNDNTYQTSERAQNMQYQYTRQCGMIVWAQTYMAPPDFHRRRKAHFLTAEAQFLRLSFCGCGNGIFLFARHDKQRRRRLQREKRDPISVLCQEKRREEQCGFMAQAILPPALPKDPTQQEEEFAILQNNRKSPRSKHVQITKSKDINLCGL